MNSYPSPLPLDPFTQKPYHYRTEGKGFVIWSIGPDLRDDQVQPQTWEPPTISDAERKPYDLVFRVTR